METVYSHLKKGEAVSKNSKQNGGIRVKNTWTLVMQEARVRSDKLPSRTMILQLTTVWLWAYNSNLWFTEEETDLVSGITCNLSLLKLYNFLSAFFQNGIIDSDRALRFTSIGSLILALLLTGQVTVAGLGLRHYLLKRHTKSFSASQIMWWKPWTFFPEKYTWFWTSWSHP